MLNTIKRSCVLVFALPIAAFAAPVTVVSHASGTAQVVRDVLGGLGTSDSPDGALLPFELTLTSSYDWSGPLPQRNQQVHQFGPVAIDFRIGDLHYNYVGDGNSYASLGAFGAADDSYYQSVGLVSFDRGYYENLVFTNTFIGPAGSFGPGGALTPNDAENSDPAGQLEITYSVPYWGGGTSMSAMVGRFDTYSVQVTSPVPEPAAFGMLALGMLTLGLRRRFGRTG